MSGAACDAKHLITVCLIEDDDFFRDRVERWIKEMDDIKCIGSYRDAESALPNIFEKKPDIVVLDFGLPGMKGGECLRRIKQQTPVVRVLVLTGIPDDSVVFDSLLAGADGFLDKSDRFSRQQQLLGQIRELHAGGTPLSRRAAKLLLEAFQRFKPRPWEDKGFSPLSEREKEILSLVKDGLSDKEIAQKLGVATYTVSTHLKNIYEKLDVCGRTEATWRFYVRA